MTDFLAKLEIFGDLGRLGRFEEMVIESEVETEDKVM